MAELFLGLVAGSVVLLSAHIHSRFYFPFPAFTQLVYDVGDEFAHRVSYERPLGSAGGFRDFAGLLFGLRRLTADVAWLSVLQYYGSREKVHEGGEKEHHHDYAGGDYPALKKMVLRVIRLDPSLTYAYLYGAGALAFNLNRSQEAVEILEEGIQSQPKYWRFQLYLGAILYKQRGQFDSMIRLLENAVTAPDCPTIVKSILANIYKSRGNFARALEIWIGVYEESKDPVYVDQAKKQISDIKSKLGLDI
ncbi:MAG: hypothetical protein HYY07_04065 [Elusimicrobia bacterium]|nr:hypothetical protein [Elusimicrobiota bacterium]